MVEGSDADQSGVVRMSLQDTRAEEEMEVWLPDGGCREVGVMRGVQTLVDQRLEKREEKRGELLSYQLARGEPGILCQRSSTYRAKSYNTDKKKQPIFDMSFWGK